jgi:hypothetical protein
MKKLGLLFTLLLTGCALGQVNIADARGYSVGQTVTVSGVATNGSELGSIRYMQDGTAGIAAYGNSLSGVQRFDSITVTGEISDFSGLLEVAPISNVINHGPAVIQPAPISISILTASEALESQLIEINNVNFVQSGTFAANTTYQVTDGANNFDVRVNTGTDLVGAVIPSGAVTVYGPEGQFNANYQIVPRDINDIVAYVAPTEEINVMLDGMTVLDGSNYFIGNTGSISVTIENYGTNNLNITGHTFTGADAGDFSSDIVAGIVTGGASGAYTINFTPAGTGSKFASIEIGSNDADENPYVINFEGVGTDNLASEPTSNASNLTFNGVEAYTLSGAYDDGVGATKYLVLWKNGSAVTGVPADGTTYQRGDLVGDSKVAYVGNATGFTPRGIIANQNYHFSVYAFNGQGGFENYLTTSPASANISSTGENIGTYYNAINSSNTSFVDDLTALINPHTFISYFNYKQTIMNEFEVRDTTSGDSYVICAYSGLREVFTGSFDWTATGFSREHVYPFSWMPSAPADTEEEYTDQHNLFPTNLNDVNQVRSNLPLGEVVTVESTFLGSKKGLDASGKRVFEPRDEIKGNAARAMMYEAVCYNETGGNWSFPDPISFLVPYGQDQSILKQWHFQDLPDNYEIARNEYIFSVQGNRNPFVDSVDYACLIDFSNMNYDANACELSLEEQLNDNINLYPVPALETLYAEISGTKINSYILVDAQGRVVLNEDKLNASGIKIGLQNISVGSYILHIETPLGATSKKVIIR